MSAFMASTSGLIAISSDTTPPSSAARRPRNRAGLMENGAPRGRAVRKPYLELQYNPLKSSAGAFLGGGGAVGAGDEAGAPLAASCSRRITS